MTDFFAFYNYRVEKYIRHENYQLESDFGPQFSYYLVLIIEFVQY